jgi:hypothetical protein
MAEAVEWYVAITALVVGVSHIARPGDWADAFRQLARCGPPGAFANGGLSLIAGAAIVAGHPSWEWPGAILTGFGWLCIAKGLACLLMPDKAVGSIARGGESPGGFVFAGMVFLALGGWACFYLWYRAEVG